MDAPDLSKYTGMIIDGVAASECIDSSGEIIEIDGVDCSQMEEDGGLLLNWEHAPGEEGASTIVGKVVYLKKIFKLSDCENDRQRMYWRKINEHPYIYVVCRLFDASGHDQARAIAAIIRDNVANDEPVAVRYSIEGSTLLKKDNRLKKSIFRRLAATVKPCNKTAHSGMISDSQEVKKNEVSDPFYTPLGGSIHMEVNPQVNMDAPEEIFLRVIARSMLLRELRKAYDDQKARDEREINRDKETGQFSHSFHKMCKCGHPKGEHIVGAECQPENGLACSCLKFKHDKNYIHKATSTSTDAPLHREHFIRNNLLAAVRDYAERPFKRDRFKEFAKHRLPEVSEEYLDHFAEMAEQYQIKKAEAEEAELVTAVPQYRWVDSLIELRKAADAVLNPPPPELPKVHRVDVEHNGQKHLAGRYVTYGGRVEHLEDYYGLMGQVAPTDLASTTLAVHGFNNNPQLAISQDAPPANGEVQPQPEVTVADDPLPPRPSVYHYFRPGMDRPHTIEFNQHGAAIDGKLLDQPELALILDNISNGLATIKFKPNMIQVTDQTQDLAKSEEMDPGDALTHVREAVKAGHIHPDVAAALTRHIYEDPMIPGVGNKYAWDKFRTQNRPGVYVSLDGNDMKHLNDTHGHSAGDASIRGIGHSLREAADKTGSGKLFRSGGDEFVAHFPTYEHAARFARHAREHMDNHPPVMGTHRLSVSMGFGHDFETSDKALYHAKAGKKDPISGQRAFAPGKVPHLAHSLVPGTEGPVPLSHVEHMTAPASKIAPPQHSAASAVV